MFILVDEHVVGEDQVDESFLSFGQPAWLGTYISTVLTWLEASTMLISAQLSLPSPAVCNVWLSRQQLMVKTDVLLHRWIRGSWKKLKFIVPKTLRGEVLRMMHDDKVGSFQWQDVLAS